MKVQNTFSIADISISLKTDADFAGSRFDSAMQAFHHDPDEHKEDMISIYYVDAHTIDFTDYIEIYDNSPHYLWKMWKAKDGNSYLISLYKYKNESLKEPYKFLRINNLFSDIQIININGRKLIHPLDYLLTLVISGYLNINRTGFLMHSAMILFKGKGYLFSGISGDGKTTLSKLWLRDKGSEVITDERVIVRDKNGIPYAFGTPWFGTSSMHKNKGAPIHKIFFIKHGENNNVRRLSAVEAANRLLVRCFPSFWHKEGMRFALDFCARIASEIECYEFGFVPDKTAVEFLKKAIPS